MSEGLTVLSLFDGMSCGRIAFDRAGIKVKKYYASEIDKYAQIVSAKNYPDIIRLGDITKWQEWDIEKPDIIIAGSPCQGFSSAGKQLNFNDPRSALFFVFVDILKHYKPKYFLLENVIMKKEYNDVISGILGEIYPKSITQKEIFRAGRLEPIEINSALVSAQNRIRLYWSNIPNITQPEDKGILLKDIIENAYADKEKAYCLDANYAKGCSKEYSDLKGRRQLVMIGKADIKGQDCIKRVYSVGGKSPWLQTCQGGNREPKILIDKNKWRKLTPLECERLQTVPNNYTENVPNSQRYKMLGNGFTVDVIAHIFKGLTKKKEKNIIERTNRL